MPEGEKREGGEVSFEVASGRRLRGRTSLQAISDACVDVRVEV